MNTMTKRIRAITLQGTAHNARLTALGSARGEGMNPFLQIENPIYWGPGTFEMAWSLINALDLSSGMRVLEVGAGSGQVAAIVAKHWDVSVVALEPWSEGNVHEIFLNSERYGVGKSVFPVKAFAQQLPFADEMFDAIYSINAFEMIGEERSQALTEMIRVAKPGACIGIAEPMCNPIGQPTDLPDNQVKHDFQSHFRTIEWNMLLFRSCGLIVEAAEYFEDAHAWWLKYLEARTEGDEERELVTVDAGRWISLGRLLGRKAAI